MVVRVCVRGGGVDAGIDEEVGGADVCEGLGDGPGVEGFDVVEEGGVGAGGEV